MTKVNNTITIASTTKQHVIKTD